MLRIELAHFTLLSKSREKLTHSEFLMFRRYPHVYGFSPIERAHEANRTALNISAKSHVHILRAARAPPTLIVQSARATKYTQARASAHTSVAAAPRCMLGVVVQRRLQILTKPQITKPQKVCVVIKLSFLNIFC